MSAATEAKLTQVETEIGTLKEELEVCKEAKTVGEACDELHGYSEKEDEPFNKLNDEPNEWHKSAGGGGCVIL